jgi:hypothetical protein
MLLRHKTVPQTAQAGITDTGKQARTRLERVQFDGNSLRQLTDAVREQFRPLSIGALRAVTVKINVTWNMMPCSPICTLKIEAASDYKHPPSFLKDSNMFFLVGTVIEYWITYHRYLKYGS